MRFISRFWRRSLVGLLAAIGFAPARAVPVDAASVVSYTAGNAPSRTDPTVALGALNPNTGDIDGGLTPFNPAFQASDIVWVGVGGSLTLQTSAPIPANGINLGVYSNAGFQDVSGNGTGQASSPPTYIGQLSKAVVSVSQDGVHFVQLNNGQPITFGMPANWFTDTPIVGGDQPLTGTQHASQSKPYLGSATDFSGMTYSQIVTQLNNSAGGTWLDLRGTGLVTVNYVRFDNIPTGGRMIVDAIGGLGAANAATLTAGARVISEDVGTGSNTSHVVVDFGPQSYDFEVHYNGSISGEQAMTLIQSNSDFRFTASTDPNFGDFLDSIDYGGYFHSGFDPNTGSFWNYYLGDGTNWTFSEVGFGTRMLSDGSYDGWVWTGGDNTPNFAVVPEPATGIAMAGIATLLLRRRRV